MFNKNSAVVRMVHGGEDKNKDLCIIYLEIWGK